MPGARFAVPSRGRGCCGPEVALVHVHSTLDAPHGPLAGRHGARFSLVLTKEAGGWQIAALHNTLEVAPGPPR